MFVSASDIGSWKLWKTSSGTHKQVSPNANTQQEHIPDMVPTPITKHSTRASKVKAGPSTAIPWAMLSLTSSWKHMSDISVSQLLLGCGNKNQNIIVHTWELELKANLARAHALERSMRSRKKGKASLKDRIKLFIARFWKSSWKKGLFIECVLTWGQWAPYQESEWQLCWIQSWRRWWKGQRCLQETQTESGQTGETSLACPTNTRALIMYLKYIWTPAVSGSGTGSKYRRWRYNA